jgi:hypothetical protein
MPIRWLVVLLGLLVGSLGSGLTAWFFKFTRPYRLARNLIVIGLGYVVVVQFAGSLLV